MGVLRPLKTIFKPLGRPSGGSGRETLFLAALFFCLAPALGAQTAAGTGTEGEYQVQRGDTIYGIARRFDVEPALLMQANGIREASQLRAGQVLKIPSVYEVQPGDTYWGIARRFDLTLEELLGFNRRSGDSLLVAGDTLQLPPRAQGAAAGPDSPSLPTPFPPRAETPPPGAAGEGARGTAFWPHQGPSSPLTGKLIGVQFSGRPGDSIRSVTSGRVIWAAPYRGYNKLIIVESPNHFHYAYGGNEITLVSEGDSVNPGMEIGRLGINPHDGVAKVFFFVYRDGKPVDPAQAPR